ncbi:uncharacterized protein B0J16DRAFT_394752 [Fusarium flagelliforme]|uniref:uncharacterized protein n=1 Tax=Fusarium flagelliforme TaxID=2675880 RepID=UPI001E8E3EE0|nr:uncharacterized protein B0J16DRAFT_394752 [Fusarium flagelliforme]KAH7192784.1 hypothetical protein B0J16DRAFT_394752 [Fusarium flagelliforme]
MENSSSSPRQTSRRPQPSLPQVQIPKAMSEPTFSPTGLLGDRYDLLRQEMEERSRSAANRPRDSPFHGGLLGALEEYENQQIPRGQQAGWSLARAPSRRSSRGPDDAQYINRPRRTSSVSSTRTDSIYCAQTGVTPAPLLDMSSTAPQRQPTWRARASTGQPLLALPESSGGQWNAPPALNRSRSMAVRPSGMGRSDTWPDAADSARLSRRISSASSPTRPMTWNEAARTEPARRVMFPHLYGRNGEHRSVGYNSGARDLTSSHVVFPFVQVSIAVGQQ